MSNGEVGKGKKPKKDPRKPDIPDTAPVDLIDFVDCKGATVTLKKGKAKWLPKLPEVDISFEEGTEAGSITITVAYGFVSVSIPASVKDGQLSVDTGKFPNVPPFSGAKKATQEWVDKFNAWLKLNGHKLDPPTLKEGSVTLAKSALAAGAPAKAAAAPKTEEPAKPGIKAGVGMKAAAGTGALLLGFGLGGFLSPDAGGGEIAIPGGPVPVEEVQAPDAAPEETVVTLPEGEVPAEITITGAPGSFDTTATFQQDGQKLTLIVPGNPPFTGTIDQQGAFSVDNQVGSFVGTIQGDQVEADHEYQNESFTMTGTLTVPIVKETDVQPNEVFTLTIGDVVFQQPAGSTSDDGANIPAAAGGGVLAVVGGGLLILDRTSKRDCSKQQKALDAALGTYRRVKEDLREAEERLPAAMEEAERARAELKEALPPGATIEGFHHALLSIDYSGTENAEIAESVFGEDVEPLLREYQEALSAERALRGQIDHDQENIVYDEDDVRDAERALAECEERDPRDFDDLFSDEKVAEVM